MEPMTQEDVPPEFQDTPQVDFQRIRKAALVYLKDLDDKNLDGGPKLNVLRDAIGAAEWKTIGPERRMWALGRGVPDLDYKKSWELAHINWEDHPNDVRKKMNGNILLWLREED